ncbi:MAG: tetraacyldisaccharide 4'-kinase [Rhodobacteraceae bacterium]|nr:tetraacyldisaccharide 4'-kinase [Paracoccaceae bacterium]
MRPPAFWYRPAEAPGLVARALAPVAWVAARAPAARVARTPGYSAPVPVICVGNLDIGGAGKTPTVIALLERLAARGIAAHVLSRGHGGRLAGPVRVAPRDHGARDVGDEPMLLSSFAPVWVSRDRAAGARAAVDAGAACIVMDDGFQNPGLVRDISVVVVDAARGWGNGRVFPSGPLREPVAAGLARADMVLSIGGGPAQAAFDASWAAQVPLPRLRAALEPLSMGFDWQGLRVVAFAGIAQPARFFATLEALGAQLVGRVALSDHQPLGVALLTRLAREADRLGAQLVTTEKDAVRLPRDFLPRVLTLPVRLVPGDWGPLETRLDALFSG